MLKSPDARLIASTTNSRRLDLPEAILELSVGFFEDE